MARLWTWVKRIGVAIYVLVAGMFGGGGLTGTVAFFNKVGYTPGEVWAPIVGSVESPGVGR